MNHTMNLISLNMIEGVVINTSTSPPGLEWLNEIFAPVFAIPQVTFIALMAAQMVFSITSLPVGEEKKDDTAIIHEKNELLGDEFIITGKVILNLIFIVALKSR